jgi:aryl-alcohol dehydrogenase-like predicted oxidoreductase
MTPSQLKLPFITYGTTRLGDTSIPMQARVKLALAAMQKGIYFHTSSSYGEAIDVLAQAFKADPVHVPKLIIKIFGNSVEEMRGNVLKYIRLLGVPCIEVAQLCPGGDVWDQLAQGGACYQAFKQMQAEGLVRHFVLEAFPWTSAKAHEALKAGHLDGAVEALIFYFNPLQRFASNELWDLARAKGTPWIALRTVGGGDLYQLRDIPGAAWKPYLQERAAQVAPLFEKSGAKTWPEFCVRFAASFSGVLGTVGSSSKLERLEALLAAAEGRQPLPQGIIDELLALQRGWSEKVDVPSEPWSM